MDSIYDNELGIFENCGCIYDMLMLMHEVMKLLRVTRDTTSMLCRRRRVYRLLAAASISRFNVVWGPEDLI